MRTAPVLVPASLLALGLGVATPGTAVAAPPAPPQLEVDPMDSPGGEAIPASEITATASTTLCEKGSKACHGPELLLDGDPATAWCEGLPGDGAGAVLTFTLKKPTALTGLYLVPHFGKSFALAEQNARIATIEIATDAGTYTAKLADQIPVVRKESVKPEPECADESCMGRDVVIGVTGEYIHFGSYAKGNAGAFNDAPVKTSKLVITLRGTYPGTKYKDTCASGLKILRAD